MTQPAYRLLFRYANRKLYDHTAKGYICARDVMRLVLEGTKVEVMGVSDKVDYTAQTLSWVLASELRDNTQAVDIEHLEAAIRSLKLREHKA